MTGDSREPMSDELSQADQIDKALLDALCHPENRKTVLEFEEQVIEFLQSKEDAFHFPLTLSGYQRLLAHRTAQHHGCQTETIGDNGEHHGKIKASRTEVCEHSSKERLSAAPVTVLAPEELTETPKLLKKKSGPERLKARDKEANEGTRAPTGQFRSLDERRENYDRARQNFMNPDGPQAGAGRIGPRLPSDSDGAGSTDSKAHFKNRAQDLQDPEFQRSARLVYRPDMQMYRPYAREGEMDVAHMFNQMSMNGGHAEHPMGFAMPGSVPMNPAAYGHGPMPAQYGYPHPSMLQQFPQGMGMHPMGVFPNGAMQYGYQVPQQQFPQGYPPQYGQAYGPFMPVRPNGLMHPYQTQQMNAGVMPIYPHYVQGYEGYQGNVAPGGRPNFPNQGRGGNGFQARPRPAPANGAGSYSVRRGNVPSTRPTRSETASVASPTAAATGTPASSSPAAPQSTPEDPVQEPKNGDGDQKA